MGLTVGKVHRKGWQSFRPVPNLDRDQAHACLLLRKEMDMRFQHHPATESQSGANPTASLIAPHLVGRRYPKPIMGAQRLSASRILSLAIKSISWLAELCSPCQRI
jgi:hypothetical protein